VVAIAGAHPPSRRSEYSPYEGPLRAPPRKFRQRLFCEVGAPRALTAGRGDCVLVTLVLDCADEGDHYEECPVSVAAGNEAMYEAALAAANS